MKHYFGWMGVGVSGVNALFDNVDYLELSKENVLRNMMLSH